MVAIGHFRTVCQNLLEMCGQAEQNGNWFETWLSGWAQSLEAQSGTNSTRDQEQQTSPK